MGVGFGIDVTATTAETLSQFNFNNMYGNVCGTVNVQGPCASGVIILPDPSSHNDYVNNPFTGADAAARAANFYQLTSAAKQVKQLFADTNYTTYPDLGAQQQYTPTDHGSIG